MEKIRVNALRGHIKNEYGIDWALIEFPETDIDPMEVSKTLRDSDLRDELMADVSNRFKFIEENDIIEMYVADDLGGYDAIIHTCNFEDALKIYFGDI